MKTFTLKQVQAIVEITSHLRVFDWVEEIVDSMRVNELCIAAGLEFDQFFEDAVKKDVWAPDEFLRAMEYWLDERFKPFAITNGYIEDEI